MGKWKTKAIQIDLGITRHSHMQKLSRHIQAYSKPYVTLAYLELWYIQNPGIFITLVYSEPQFFQNNSINKSHTCLLFMILLNEQSSFSKSKICCVHWPPWVLLSWSQLVRNHFLVLLGCNQLFHSCQFCTKNGAGRRAEAKKVQIFWKKYKYCQLVT